MVRASLEEIQNPIMEFRMWDSVLEETRRLHLSWLNVTKDRLRVDHDLIAAAEEQPRGPDAMPPRTASRRRQRLSTDGRRRCTSSPPVGQLSRVLAIHWPNYSQLWPASATPYP